MKIYIYIFSLPLLMAPTGLAPLAFAYIMSRTGPVQVLNVALGAVCLVSVSVRQNQSFCSQPKKQIARHEVSASALETKESSVLRLRTAGQIRFCDELRERYLNVCPTVRQNIEISNNGNLSAFLRRPHEQKKKKKRDNFVETRCLISCL